MFFWFVGLAFALVLVVFDSPMLDYRLVMAGSLLPWLDELFAPPWLMHSVFFPVLVMSTVMVAGWGKRLVQRRWIGVAIGVFMHLVLAGSFTDAEIFWWPALGVDASHIQRATPSPAVAVVLELIGLAVLGWLWSRLGMADPKRRRHFIATGHLDRIRTS